jgi:porin
MMLVLKFDIRLTAAHSTGNKASGGTTVRRLATNCATIILLTGTTAFAQGETDDIDESQSGYEQTIGLGGPDGVSEELARNDEARESRFEFEGFQRAFAGYFDWKRELKKDFGVSFGFQYYLLPQFASSSLDDKGAAGSIFRFNGTWSIFERANGNLGRIDWRFEHRGNVFGQQSPNDLSGAIGAAALNTGFGYSSSFDLDLAVINWVQGFRGSTTGIAAGRLAFDVYLDAMPFQTFSRGFMNRAFLLNPTIGTTGIGALGAVAKGYVTDQIWVGGQVHDANATSGSFDWDTVREGEWLSAVEVGWSPSIAERKQKMVQLTYWHKDARELAGTSSGNGWAVSAAYQLSEKYFPFVRFGSSNGGAGVAAEASLSGGIEIAMRPDETWTLGAGWARPSERTHGSGLRNEWVVESSYKFQLGNNFSLTPDVQWLFNPANNPDRSSVIVAGVRFIMVL